MARSKWLKKAIGEMAQGSQQETALLNASISAQIKPEDIPLAPGVDLDALKSGDTEPMEIVVEVPAGKSKRGWNYQATSLQAIVKHVQEKTLSGFLGHQRAEDVDNKFEPPVTHWVGAIWKDGKAYFRGVVDAAAKDLKRWIKAGRIKQVSIFGIPKVTKVSGETQVVDYMPLSIDWTPLDRAGMPTRIVAIGEMDEILSGGGDNNMTWKELVAELKNMMANREVTTGQVVGEMGWKAQEVAEVIDSKWLKEVTGAVETLTKVKETLGISGEMDVLSIIKDAAAALNEKQKADHTKVIDQAVSEKVAGEMAQGLIKKLLVVPEDATKEQIVGEIDKLLADETLKEAFSKLHIDKPAGVVTSTKVKEQSTGLRTRKVSI